MRNIDDILLKTGSDATNTGNKTTQLIIDASDNKVGIGNVTPTQKLDVDGQIRMRGTSGTAGYIPVSDVDGVMTWTDPSTLSIGSDHDWYVKGTTSQPSSINDNIYTEGNVGIGTQNMSTPLKVDLDGNSTDEYTINFSKPGSPSGSGWSSTTRVFNESNSGNHSRFDLVNQPHNTHPQTDIWFKV